jgi:hypothetical protein
MSLHVTPPTVTLEFDENAGTADRKMSGALEDSVSEKAAVAKCGDGVATASHVAIIADNTTLGSARATERLAAPLERSAADELYRVEPATEREKPLEGKSGDSVT